MAYHNGFIRKRVWVNGLIQGRILTYISIYWVLYHFLLLHATFIYGVFQNREAVLVGEDALPITVVYGQFLSEHAGFVCCALFVLPVILFDALWFSHRIVGPLYRIRVALQQLAAGVELNPIRLRTGDYLNDVADAVNRVRDRMEHLQGGPADGEAEPAHGRSGENQNILIDRRELARLRAAAERNQTHPSTSRTAELLDDVDFEPELHGERETTFAQDSLEADLIERTLEIEELVNAQRAKDLAEQASGN
ncbi:MAG: hypothetical protein WEB58_02580 [Planctomycetaceae bacterium]